MTVPRGAGDDEALPRARRVTPSSEIRALFRRGKRSRTPHLDVFDSPSPAAHPRVGLVVPRHRRRIVERNVLKRRLREVLRRDVLPRLRNRHVAVDVLVRARREAYDAGYGTLRAELIDWAERRWSRASS
jgi:ribonuclease P protein component